MSNLLQLKIIGGILCPLAVVGTMYATAQAQPQSASGPISAPNVTLNVQRSAGNCPKTVGLWWLALPQYGSVKVTHHVN